MDHALFSRRMKPCLYWMGVLLCITFGGCDSSSGARTEQAPNQSVDSGVTGLNETDGMTELPNESCAKKSTEVCDGKDNDCDDKVDEDFPIGKPCSVDKGECTSLGVWACAGDNQKAICDAPPFEMSDEICDGKDNDCDGKKDETFAFETNPDHCGSCDNVCTFDNARGDCRASQCQLGDCEPGFIDLNGELADGCECRLSNGGVENCDGTDNDCDGKIDEGFDVGQACSVGVGACAATGQMICSDDGINVQCGVEPGMPTDEICNGYDDDCDGQSDETFDGDDDGAVFCPDIDCDNCPADVNCEAICGNMDCNDNDPSIHPRAAEICEDMVDQNCDGLDSACRVLTGRLNLFEMIKPDEEGCRDIDGDGNADNVLAPLAGAANALLGAEISAGNINLIAIFYGLETSNTIARFDFAIGYAQNNRLTAESIGGDGRPNVMFTGAQMNNGRLQAGPQATDIPLPVPGNAVILTAENSLITGTVTLPFEENGVTGVKVINGVLTAAAPRDALIDTVRRNQRDLLFLVEDYEPDIDTDGDGVKDALSICARFTVVPTMIEGVPPALRQ